MNMCAINPKHKKRFIIDVYTSRDVSREFFEQEAIDKLLKAEIDLNSSTYILRFHIKESTETGE